MASSSSHPWKFFRSGGLDQVLLETDADLRHLHELDLKLWVALSCPVKGLELSEQTLTLVDTDKDGRIRVPEVLDAVAWAGLRLRDLGVLMSREPGVPLKALRDDTLEGNAVLESAKQILVNLGQEIGPDARITVEETSDTGRIFAQTGFNGDGIITVQSTKDSDLVQLINEIAGCLGAETDRSGLPGISAGKIEQFYAELSAHAAWASRGTDAGILVVGEATPDALAAVQAVRNKVEDYFARAKLVAFDAKAAAAVNRGEGDFAALAGKDLKASGEEWLNFPLARVEAGKPLPLADGVNPAWASALANLQAAAVAPLLGSHKSSLTYEEWTTLCTKLAAYESWLAAKPGVVAEQLGAERIESILAADRKAALLDLVAKDKALEPQALAIANVDRLVRYQRDLGVLLRNFVNFADFYDPQYPATFQVGTLFLDSRSCDLCFRVDGASPLAAMSKAFIAYCTVTRGGLSMNIAACFTQGDSDFLFVGRHGVFYDRKGQDWDAVITSVVENPISIRQAFWSPYKRFIRMIEENVAKRAAAAEAESNSRLAAAAEKTAHADKAKPAEAPKKVDVGAVAAIGVAVTGAVSALTLILGYVFGMRAWQYPLALMGLMLIISGPSMLIAWLKLRQRTLGPILDANGWAINGRVKVNIPLGTSLTHLAVIPEGATTLKDDPFEDRGAARRKRLFITVLVLAALVSIGIYADRLHRGHYFWQDPKPVEAPAAPAPAAPTEAKAAEPAK